MANTEFMLWIIVAFCGLLLLSIIVGVFLFVFRRQTILRILMPDRSIYTKRFFLKQLPKTIDLGNMGIYFIDEHCMFKTFFGYVLHYTFNNPEPIEEFPSELKPFGTKLTKEFIKKHKLFNFPTQFNITENIPTDAKRRSQNLESFHKDGLIKELFTRENITKLLLLLLIINLVISVVGIGYNIITGGDKNKVVKCELAKTENNTKFIRDAVIGNPLNNPNAVK